MWFFQTIRQASAAHSVQMAFINAAKSTYGSNVKRILQDVTDPQKMRSFLSMLDKDSIANTPGVPKDIQQSPATLFKNLSDQEVQYIVHMIKQSPTIEKESEKIEEELISLATLLKR